MIYDLEAERNVIAILVSDPTAIERVQFLEAEDFYTPQWKRVYDVIEHLPKVAPTLDDLLEHPNLLTLEQARIETAAVLGSTDRQDIQGAVDNRPSTSHVKRLAYDIFQRASERRALGNLDKVRVDIEKGDTRAASSKLRAAAEELGAGL